MESEKMDFDALDGLDIEIASHGDLPHCATEGCDNPVTFRCTDCASYYLCDDCMFADDEVPLVNGHQDTHNIEPYAPEQPTKNPSGFNFDLMNSSSGGPPAAHDEPALLNNSSAYLLEELASMSVCFAPCRLCCAPISDDEEAYSCIFCPGFVVCPACGEKYSDVPPPSQPDDDHVHKLERVMRPISPQLEGVNHASFTQTTTVEKRYDKSGNKIINNYVVVKLIGRGANAKVKLIQHIDTGELYAMKILRKRDVERSSFKKHLTAARAEDFEEEEEQLSGNPLQLNVEPEEDGSKTPVSIPETPAPSTVPKSLPTVEVPMFTEKKEAEDGREEFDIDDDEGEESGEDGRTAGASQPSARKSAFPETPKKRQHGYEDILKEIATLKFLDHPNIIRLVEVIFDEVREKVYIITEYCEKGCIYDTGRPAMPLADVRRVSRELLAGLLYLHAQRLYHRDVKPANCLVSGDDSVKLSDFGTCQSVRKGESTSQTVGTLPYIPPECFAGSADRMLMGEAMDSWAFGISVLEMATGQLPWDTTTQLTTMESVKSSEPVPIPDELDDDLKDMLRKLLEKDPMKRTPLPMIADHPFLGSGILQMATGGAEVRPLSPAFARGTNIESAFYGESRAGGSGAGSEATTPSRHSSNNFGNSFDNSMEFSVLSFTSKNDLTGSRKGGEDDDDEDDDSPPDSRCSSRRRTIAPGALGIPQLSMASLTDVVVVPEYNSPDRVEGRKTSMFEAPLSTPLKSFSEPDTPVKSAMAPKGSSRESRQRSNSKRKAKTMASDTKTEDVVRMLQTANHSTLNLDSMNLAEVEESVTLAADFCTKLTANYNSIRAVSSKINFERFETLTHVRIIGNQLTTIPEGLLEAPSLESLDLSQNHIEDITPSALKIRAHPTLRKLSLHGNRIASIMTPLPSFRGASLMQLRLTGNPIKQVLFKKPPPERKSSSESPPQVFVTPPASPRPLQVHLDNHPDVVESWNADIILCRGIVVLWRDVHPHQLSGNVFVSPLKNVKDTAVLREYTNVITPTASRVILEDASGTSDESGSSSPTHHSLVKRNSNAGVEPTREEVAEIVALLDELSKDEKARVVVCLPPVKKRNPSAAVQHLLSAVAKWYVAVEHVSAEEAMARISDVRKT